MSHLARILTALLTALACASWATVAAGTPISSSIRLGIHGDKTRLVIELSEPLESVVFGLTDPDRLVIDLPELDWRIDGGQPHPGEGVVAQYRFGLFRPGTSRVVLDLVGPVEVQDQFLLPPNGGAWRLVLDLVPMAPATLAAVTAGPAAAVAPTVTMPPTMAVPKPKPIGAMAAAAPEPPPMIVIDPGHGGIDSGAVGVNGAREKNIVLDYALELQQLLLDHGGFRVSLTRDADVFLPLRERTHLARLADADLFISLHVNTDPSGQAHGFSVYTLSEKASDTEAAALAEKENKADIIAGVDLTKYSTEVANILIDFAQAKTNEMSVTFARDNLIDEVASHAPVVRRPWRSAGFAVLKLPDVPSVLVELGYVSNQAEEAALQQQDYRRNLCDALVRAIDRYFISARHNNRS